MKVSELLSEAGPRGATAGTTVLSVSEPHGIVPQEELFRRRIALDDLSKYRVVKEGDIVYNPFLLWNGAVGACFIPGGGCVSPAYVVLRPKDPSLTRFLHYFLRSASFTSAVDAIAAGSVTRRRVAPLPDILKLDLNLPPMPSLRMISGLFDVLDEKIDVNQRIAARLEQLARDLYRAWFVDFEPMHGSSRVPDGIRRLFPNRRRSRRCGRSP